MKNSESKIVSSYLSKIGRKGGKTSKRKLDPVIAKEMVKVREAKRAFESHYHECFWSFDPSLKITKNDIQWVADQLMKNGSLEHWKIGKKLCQ